MKSPSLKPANEKPASRKPSSTESATQSFAKQDSTTPWKLICRLAAFQWRYCALNVLFSVLGWLLFLVPGLVVREFLDLLVGKGHWGFPLWGLIALFGLNDAVRVLLNFADTWVSWSYRYTNAALLRYNLFEHILRHPNIRSVSDSSGEAITRFRDDVDQAGGLLNEVLYLTGPLAFAVTALVIMMRINTFMTLVVFVPLVVVVICARVASQRIERYRKASQEATGRLTERWVKCSVLLKRLLSLAQTIRS
jgi:ATP-binding cassette subfamily B protein